jgi:hypothetical protein
MQEIFGYAAFVPVSLWIGRYAVVPRGVLWLNVILMQSRTRRHRDSNDPGRLFNYFEESPRTICRLVQ